MRNFHRKRERGKKKIILSSAGHRFIVRWIINVTLWGNSAQRVPFPAPVVLLPLWFSACVWPWVTSPWKVQGDFREVSPTLGTLFVFYCTSRCVFHLGGGKKIIIQVIVLAWKINVCVHRCISINIENDVGGCVSKYIFLWGIFTECMREHLFLGELSRSPKHFCAINGIFCRISTSCFNLLFQGSKPSRNSWRKSTNPSQRSLPQAEALSVWVQCPPSGPFPQEGHAGLHPCHPVSHSGLIYWDCWQEAAMGKRGFFFLQWQPPGCQSCWALSGLFPPPVFSGFCLGWWHRGAGHGFGLFRFNESLVVKYPHSKGQTTKISVRVIYHNHIQNHKAAKVPSNTSETLHISLLKPGCYASICLSIQAGIKGRSSKSKHKQIKEQK